MPRFTINPVASEPQRLDESSVFPRAKAHVQQLLNAGQHTKVAELLYTWARSATIMEDEFVQLLEMVRARN